MVGEEEEKGAPLPASPFHPAAGTPRGHPRRSLACLLAPGRLLTSSTREFGRPKTASIRQVAASPRGPLGEQTRAQLRLCLLASGASRPALSTSPLAVAVIRAARLASRLVSSGLRSKPRPTAARIHSLGRIAIVMFWRKATRRTWEVAEGLGLSLRPLLRHLPRDRPPWPWPTHPRVSCRLLDRWHWHEREILSIFCEPDHWPRGLCWPQAPPGEGLALVI